MTSITDIASLMAAHNNYIPSNTDVSAWKTVTPYVGTDPITTKVGLFGADLTTFNSDCLALGPAGCRPIDYADYNGWALGVQWSGTAVVDNKNRLWFADTLTFV